MFVRSLAERLMERKEEDAGQSLSSDALFIVLPYPTRSQPTLALTKNVESIQRGGRVDSPRGVRGVTKSLLQVLHDATMPMPRSRSSARARALAVRVGYPLAGYATPPPAGGRAWGPSPVWMAWYRASWYLIAR